MECGSCGATVPEGAQFCDRCGARLTPESAQPGPLRPRPRRARPALIAAGVAVIGAAAAAAFLLLRDESSPRPAGPDGQRNGSPAAASASPGRSPSGTAVAGTRSPTAPPQRTATPGAERTASPSATTSPVPTTTSTAGTPATSTPSPTAPGVLPSPTPSPTPVPPSPTPTPTPPPPPPPTATPTSQPPATFSLRGRIYVRDAASGTNILCPYGCVIALSGPAGQFFAIADGNGAYSVELPAGTYQTADVTFDFCALPPVVSPPQVTVSGSRNQDFVTTGCIVY